MVLLFWYRQVLNPDLLCGFLWLQKTITEIRVLRALESGNEGFRVLRLFDCKESPIVRMIQADMCSSKLAGYKLQSN